MKVAVDEGRAQFLRPKMSDMALAALCGAYVRYLAERTNRAEESIQDSYYTETGMQPERDMPKFRRWAGDKVYMLDQLRIDPFGEEAVYGR
jgi:hypothetical protein